MPVVGFSRPYGPVPICSGGSGGTAWPLAPAALSLRLPPKCDIYFPLGTHSAKAIFREICLVSLWLADFAVACEGGFARKQSGMVH